MSKALRQNFFNTDLDLYRFPYTITYVIRKRIQIDNINELPKEKRPPDSILWFGTQEDIEEWLDRVFDKNNNPEENKVTLVIDDIEG